MNSESRLLVELWDLVGDQFNKSQRVEAVITILRSFQDFGIEPEEFLDATEEDPYLKSGYDVLVEMPEDNHSDEENEDD